VRKLVARFLRDEWGQDLIEYTLLLSFVALAATGLFMGSGKSISGIWTSSNSQLGAANTSLSGSQPAPPHGDGHGDGNGDGH
jgi:Flp pilus assembly pilin Flp